MKNAFTNYLLEHKFIEKFQTGFNEHIRLSTELICHFDAKKIAFLKNEYTPEREKGGVIFLSPSLVNGQRIFYVEEIIFVTNRSDTPHRSYRPDAQELKNAREEAIRRELLPFDFHSHPTKGDNIFTESLNYHNQLNTSDADKRYQLNGIQVGEIKLRLPEILIVANGQMKSGLFIGFYSGLIAPLDFTERKHQVMVDFMQKSYQRMQNYFDTPQRKAIGAIAGVAAAIGLVALFVKYPKAIFPTVIGTASIVPGIAYASPNENKFFGISNGLPLKILLPKINDEQIIENEKKILSLYEEWKQGR